MCHMHLMDNKCRFSLNLYWCQKIKIKRLPISNLRQSSLNLRLPNTIKRLLLYNRPCIQGVAYYSSPPHSFQSKRVKDFESITRNRCVAESGKSSRHCTLRALHLTVASPPLFIHSISTVRTEINCFPAYTRPIFT